MALSSTVQGLWRFNSSLTEEARNEDFTSPLGFSPAFEQFKLFDLIAGETKTKNGLKFEKSRPYTAGTSFNFSVNSLYQLTIGFFWNSPRAVGFIRHNVSRNLTTRIAPILAKANSSTSGLREIVTGSEFIVSEVAISSKKNAIQFALCTTNGNPTHIFRSDGYIPGLRHVFITYGSLTSTDAFVRIDIDGKFGVQHYAPTNQTASSGALRLNDIGYSYESHKLTQSDAFISDLIIRSTAPTSSKDTIKMSRYGLDFIADSSLFFKDFNSFGASYHQPSTVSTNQIFVEGGNIFSARSDGELLKGTRPIWDTEFELVNISGNTTKI